MILEQIDILSQLNFVSILCRILLAVLLGGLLGIEREQKQRPAGFRTYIIVCLGATLSCITNIYMCEFMGSSDPARIPAQVISGIGFLGAGTILVTQRNHIKGLTTAAGLWCSATIGIAIGTGFYSGAILCTIAIVFSLRILSIVDKRFTRFNKYICIYAEYTNPEFIHSLITYSKTHVYDLHDIEIYPIKDSSIYSVTFTIKITAADNRQQVIEDLREISSVIILEELAP